MKIHQLFRQITSWSIMATAFLSVLLVVPTTENFIDHSKTYLLFFGSILVLLFFVIKSLKQKAVKLTISPISGALLFFGLAVAASTFFASPYPVKALLGMGGIYISASIISIFGGSLIPKDSTSKFINGMTITSLLLILATALQMIGFGPAQLINKLLDANFQTSMVFSVAGSSFIALQVLFVTLVGLISTILADKKASKFFAISLPTLLIGAGVFAWTLLPGKETSLKLPSLSSSWSIMLDSVKNPRAALIGSGPESYSSVYNIFKPLWINNTEDWSITFSQARIFPITIITTLGVIGLFCWIFFVFKFSKLRKGSLISSKPIINMIASIILLQLLFPTNTILITIQAVAIACLIANEKHRLPLLQLQALRFRMLNKSEFGDKTLKISNLPLYFSAGIGLVSVTALFYLVGTAYAANVVMAQSGKLLSKNDLVGAYVLQQKAIALNPYLDSFRRKYSSTNMIIAIALSNKADISEEEKQQVSSLLQQSVREARAATTIDSKDYQNWLNLAQIYKNMIGVSEDAASWTVQSFVSAIENNPSDPALRIELAQVFASQENYSQAINILTQAINIKPDLAGSHFNLALVLEKVGQPDEYRLARISYQRALVLLDSDSQEYVLVNQKIEDLEKMMKEKDISLEAENSLPQTGDQQKQAVDESQVPSLIEQNLDNPKMVGSDENKDVILDVSAQETSSKIDLSEEL